MKKVCLIFIVFTLFLFVGCDDANGKIDLPDTETNDTDNPDTDKTDTEIGRASCRERV